MVGILTKSPLVLNTILGEAERVSKSENELRREG